MSTWSTNLDGYRNLPKGGGAYQDLERKFNLLSSTSNRGRIDHGGHTYFSGQDGNYYMMFRTYIHTNKAIADIPDLMISDLKRNNLCFVVGNRRTLSILFHWALNLRGLNEYLPILFGMGLALVAPFCGVFLALLVSGARNTRRRWTEAVFASATLSWSETSSPSLSGGDISAICGSSEFPTDLHPCSHQIDCGVPRGRQYSSQNLEQRTSLGWSLPYNFCYKPQSPSGSRRVFRESPR